MGPQLSLNAQMVPGKTSRRPDPIRDELDRLYEKFNDRRWHKTDPIQFAYRYERTEDIEIVALIAALFAYGNVKAMCSAIGKVIDFLGNHPAEKLGNIEAEDLRKNLPGVYYRFYSTQDIHRLLLQISKALQKERNLRERMKVHWKNSDENILICLKNFRSDFVLKNQSSNGMKFMFPDPEVGAAKRLHMFLRWMVRSDEVDLGLWEFIPRSALIVPLDTHVFKAAHRLGFTKRKSPTLAAALEVTAALRNLCPSDPLKYDFALCHSGMLDLTHP